MILPSGEPLSDHLIRRLGRILSRRRSVALALWGEPGIGKTWTVEQTLQNLACRSLRLEADVPYPTLVNLLPRPAELPLWLETALERLSAGTLDTDQAVTALAGLLSALAPFVLVIEDLHKARTERLELWQKLAQAILRTQGVGLLATTWGLPPEPFEAFRLRALSLAASSSILEQQSHQTLPVGACEWIYDQAQGNPLFTLEYFRFLTREGYLWSDGQRWRWRKPSAGVMPDTVEALIAQTLANAQLSAQDWQALGARSVLSSLNDPILWAKVAGLSPEEFTLSLVHLERAGILSGGSFVHPLFREVAYRELPSTERQKLAQQAIQALHDQPDLALQYLNEAGLETEPALELLEQALEASRKRQDVRQEVLLLSQKVNLVPAEQRGDLALETARRMQEYSLAQALELAEIACNNLSDAFEGCYLKASLMSRLGRGKEAEHILSRFPAAERTTPRWIGELMQVRHNSHDYVGVLGLWENPSYSEILRTHDQIPYALVARSYIQLRRLEEAEALLKLALERPQIAPEELARLLYIRTFIPHFAGDFVSAEYGFTAFLDTLQTLPVGSLRQQLRDGTLQLRAYARNALERPTEALRDIQEAMQAPAASGNGALFAFRQAEYGAYLMELGDYTQAEDAILEARGVLERTSNPIYMAWVERIAARLYLEWAPPHGAALALRHARASLQFARQAKSPTFEAGGLFIAAWAEAWHGRAETALELVPKLRELAQNTRQPVFLGAATWIEGLALQQLGQTPEAIQALRKAIELAKPSPLGPSPQRMALELDRLLGDRASAVRRIRAWAQLNVRNAILIAQRYFPDSQPQPETAPPELSPAVHLLVLGPVQILVDGIAISDRNRKGKQMLAQLLEARLGGRNDIGQLEFYDTLYPEMTEAKAASALKQLVYRLRSSLGPEAILRTATGYALGAVSSDAEAFLNTADTKLWRGPYMEDISEGWESLSADALYSNLQEKARDLLGTQPKEAARLGLILLEADSYNLEALALTLRALERDHNHQTLVRIYQQAQKRMLEVGTQLPLAWKEFLSRQP